MDKIISVKINVTQVDRLSRRVGIRKKRECCEF